MDVEIDADADVDVDVEMGADAIGIPAEKGLIWTGNHRITLIMEHTNHPSWPHVNFIYGGKVLLHQMAEQFLFNHEFY